jgi:hypothetical protein
MSRLPGWAVASIAAVSSLVLIGGVAWFVGSISSGEPSATTGPASTVTEAGGWQVVSYSAADGLPPGGVDGIAAADGVTWAVVQSATGLQMYGLEGDRWEAVGDVLDAPNQAWMIPDGTGGVLLSVPPPGWSEESPWPPERVVHFDGQRWIGFEEGGLMPDLSMSTVTTGPDGTTWIVGYTAEESERLVVGRVSDGGIFVSVDNRLPASWPSFLTVGYTGYVAPDGALWIGSPEGATRFSDGTFGFFGIEEPDDDCCYGPLAVDAEGSVWLLRGRVPYRLVDGVWNELPSIGAPSVDVVAPIVATPDGGVWVFSRQPERGQYFTHRFDVSGWVTYSQDEAAEMGIPVATSSEFRAIDAPDGTVVTTVTLHRFADDNWERLPTDGLSLGPDNSADWSRRGIAISTDGSIWVPTLDGAARMIPSA